MLKAIYPENLCLRTFFLTKIACIANGFQRINVPRNIPLLMPDGESEDRFQFPQPLNGKTLRHMYEEIILKCFSTLGMFATQETFGNTWSSFGLSQLKGRGEYSTCIQWVEARDAVDSTWQYTEQPPITRNYPSQNVNSAEAEKTCPKLYVLHSLPE